jgi:hypothetical protein
MLEINAKLVNSFLIVTCRLQIVVGFNKHNYIYASSLDVTEEYSVVEVKALRSLEVLFSDPTSLEFSVVLP